MNKPQLPSHMVPWEPYDWGGFFMAKGKKGKALVLGGLLGLGLWILWQLGLALLAVKEVLPEDALAPGQWAGAFLAAFVGSRLAVRHSGLGTLAAALGAAAVGLAVLLAFIIKEIGEDNGHTHPTPDTTPDPMEIISEPPVITEMPTAEPASSPASAAELTQSPDSNETDNNND